MKDNPNQEEMFPLPEKDFSTMKEEKNIEILRKTTRKMTLIEEMRSKSNKSTLKKAAEENRASDPINNPNIINLKEARKNK